MATGVVVSGIREFNGALTMSVDRALLAARHIVEQGAVIVASEAKRTFRPRPGGQHTSQRTGRIYYDFRPPFEAIPPTPTSRSGNLQASLGRVGAVTPIRGGWMALTGTRLEYAPFVEFGTSRMAKEPFLEQGLERSRSQIEALAQAEWEAAVA